jgi:hypothetical protein
LVFDPYLDPNGWNRWGDVLNDTIFATLDGQPYQAPLQDLSVLNVKRGQVITNTVLLVALTLAAVGLLVALASSVETDDWIGPSW